MHIFGITSNKNLKHTYQKENSGKWQNFMGQVNILEPIKQISSSNDASKITVCVVLFESGLVKFLSRDENGVLIIRKQTEENFPNIGCVSASGLYYYFGALLPNGNCKISFFYSHYLSGISNDYPTIYGTKETFSAENSFPECKHFDSTTYSNRSTLYSYICLVDTNGDIQIVKHEARNVITIFDSVLRLPNNEKFSKVACTMIDETLHIVGLSKQGNLYHIAYGSQNKFGNIETKSGEVGQFTHVSCCARNGHLNVLATTDAGQLKHTYRAPNGKWQSFWGDVESVAGGESGHYIGCSISKSI